MFERFTEKARRVIFFARSEASQYGSHEIDTDHLLLGLIREEKLVCARWLPNAQPDAIRKRIDSWMQHGETIPANVDLPLSAAGRQVLTRAKEEADRLNSKWIGTEHLLLGLIEEQSPVSDLLHELGGEAGQLRAFFERESKRPEFAGAASSGISTNVAGPVNIHGSWRNLRAIEERVQRCKLYNWHWHKASWRPRDLAVEKKTCKISLDLSLSENAAEFEIVKGGWKKDKCAVCGWELFESEDDHGSGYSNGQQWVCLECYDKFWQRPDFISGSYGDLS